jgi:hypothetical protein
LAAVVILSDACILGDACEDALSAPMTQTADVRGTLGAEQWHIQLTALAGEGQ